MSDPPQGAREIELKLEFDPEDRDRLQGHALLRRLAHGRSTTREVRSVYFDTPQLALLARGLALRVRDTEHGFLQTVKRLGEGRGGLFDRPEIETSLPGPTPEPEAVADPELRSWLLAETSQGGGPLQPVLETEVRRTQRSLRFEGAALECVVDVGEVRTRQGALPIHELELELRSGNPAALFDLALTLQEDVPLHPATESKPEKGFALLTGVTPTPRRARRTDLPAEAPLDALLTAVVGDALAQILGNRAVAGLGEDPEGVHQLRVGCRRLRSAFALFKRALPRSVVEPLREELRWLASELGPARDLDVFLVELLEPLLRVREGDGALKRIRDEAVAARAEAYDRVRAALASPRTARLLLRLGRLAATHAWREQPLTPESAQVFAPAREVGIPLLARRYRKVREAGRELAAKSAPELHALRIEMKKLRYASEFLASLFPRKRAERFARRAARLQDVLGHLNDVAVAERLLALQLERMGAEAGAEHQRAAGFVTGWAAHSAGLHLEHLERRWRHFEGTEVFWE